jgi:hypothetical protein
MKEIRLRDKFFAGNLSLNSSADMREPRVPMRQNVILLCVDVHTVT